MIEFFKNYPKQAATMRGVLVFLVALVGVCAAVDGPTQLSAVRVSDD